MWPWRDGEEAREGKKEFSLVRELGKDKDETSTIQKGDGSIQEEGTLEG
jgi:hypothetical protein